VAWIIGQRVIAELEPELGLGLVVKIIGDRLIEVLFSAAEISRQYVQKSPPLRRVILSIGQKVESKDGVKITIEKRTEKDGLYLYEGQGNKIWEYELSHFVDDKSAIDQFGLGQWGRPVAFDLRQSAWDLLIRSLDPEIRGLVGPRTMLLPYQLYIAREIASRLNPRVLLSDEVGLGKTIEAGLIYSSLKALGRADRVLILVPEALQHQWLAELYRCFDEVFALVDEERSEQESLSQEMSAFEMNQRILCPLKLFVENPDLLEQAASVPWDLIIVDEAHHLAWTLDSPSTEWEMVKILAEKTRGLLLLTATPERDGNETLFGLLHLVDPERFADYDEFEKEMKHVKETGEWAKVISEGKRDATSLKSLIKYAKEDDDLRETLEEYQKGDTADALLNKLIDRHGTGRVLVRNRRARLRGFPGREPRVYSKEPNAEFVKHLKAQSPSKVEPKVLGQISSGANQWKSRGEWLLEVIKSLNGAKALLICSDIRRTLQLAEWLKTQSAVRTAVFHEDLEIVERDRQSAWFANPEGAQILICSEIGGEGRNFQFAHELILFDLPFHPDILEQRIGRLDRIGQKHKIRVHALAHTGTPEEVLLDWYNAGLNSFGEAWNGGAILDDKMEDVLIETFKTFLPKHAHFDERDKQLAKLRKHTQTRVKKLREQERESRDLLVDLNSYNEKIGLHLVDKVKHEDADPSLRVFLEQVYDYFGIEREELDGGKTFKITAHSLSFIENFPGLTAEGERLVTFDRNHALTREELAFLTLDHTLVQGAMGLVLEGTHGRASAAEWKGARRKGLVFFQLLYTARVTAPLYLEVERDLPPLKFTVNIAADGERLELPPDFTAENLTPLKPEALGDALPELQKRLRLCADKAERWVVQQVKDRIKIAREKMVQRMKDEHDRLIYLSRVNPFVTSSEIAAHKDKMAAALTALESVQPRLDSLRLIIASS